MTTIKSNLAEVMSAQDAYDLAFRKGVPDPAVFRLGERCIVGKWLAIAVVDDKSFGGKAYVLRSKTKAVQVLGEGTSWYAAAKAAGLLGPVPSEACLKDKPGPCDVPTCPRHGGRP